MTICKDTPAPYLCTFGCKSLSESLSGFTTGNRAATVCYTHFFIFPYPLATYTKRAAYRLKAVSTCLLPRLFIYFAV